MSDDQALVILREEFSKTDNTYEAGLNAFVGLGRLALSNHAQIEEKNLQLVDAIFSIKYLAGNMRECIRKKELGKNFRTKVITLYQSVCAIIPDVIGQYGSLNEEYKNEFSLGDLQHLLKIMSERLNSIREDEKEGRQTELYQEEVEQLQALSFGIISGLIPKEKFDSFHNELIGYINIFVKFKEVNEMTMPSDKIM